MKALITGASSGIGREIALYLSDLGYDIIVVARNERALRDIQREIKTKVEVVAMDLTDRENAWKLHEMYKDEPIEVLVNNAGFGVHGLVTETNLEKDLELIDLNITALHILTKLFLSDMKKRNLGYILNVSSIAGFMPGPLMAEYYASKNFVLSYTKAIYTELKKEGSEVHISALCPGPTKTNFNKVANVDFKMKSYSAEYVAEYGINKMFEEKLVIVPGIKMKLTHMASRILPSKLMSNFAYEIQKRKRR
ncbi:MAG: SDR family oxidoreductase [Clostridia bacterium]|jgi:short-subunit dehydrogenase|nr:SDR family oxidoreductase [Clostridia bacterium]